MRSAFDMLDDCAIQRVVFKGPNGKTWVRELESGFRTYTQPTYRRACKCDDRLAHIEGKHADPWHDEEWYCIKHGYNTLVYEIYARYTARRP